MLTVVVTGVLTVMVGDACDGVTRLDWVTTSDWVIVEVVDKFRDGVELPLIMVEDMDCVWVLCDVVGEL